MFCRGVLTTMDIITQIIICLPLTGQHGVLQIRYVQATHSAIVTRLIFIEPSTEMAYIIACGPKSLSRARAVTSPSTCRLLVCAEFNEQQRQTKRGDLPSPSQRHFYNWTSFLRTFSERGKYRKFELLCMCIFSVMLRSFGMSVKTYYRKVIISAFSFHTPFLLYRGFSVVYSIHDTNLDG